MRVFLLILGTLTAFLILAQLVMGQLMLGGQVQQYVKAHQHTGYLTVVVSLLYVGLSLATIAGTPRRERV